MGTIYKRGNTYWIQYYRNGKPYRESTRGSKETDAKRLLKKREGDPLKKKLQESQVQIRIETFNEIIDELFVKNPHDRHIGQRLRLLILLRDGKRCTLCGKNGDETRLEIDHIVPASEGGLTIPENLRTLCHECNIGKSNIFKAQ